MTLEEKQILVAKRLALATALNAENSTSYDDELEGIFRGGVRGTNEWTEAELDEYLDTHDLDGQFVSDDPDDDDEFDERDARRHRQIGAPILNLDPEGDNDEGQEDDADGPPES